VFKTTNESVFILMLVYVLILAYCLIKAGNLFLKRNVPFKGMMPRSIYKNADDIMDPNHNPEQIFYWHQIGRYQIKIDEIEADNKNRSSILTAAMISAFVLFFYTIIIFVIKQNGLL
jgi:hypothetical protein